MQKIFISHDSYDATLACAVEKLIDEITKGSIKIVNSSSKEMSSKIPLGHEWLDWIKEQVSTSDITIVLLTASSVKNSWVTWESGAVWGIAAASGKSNSILPLCAGILPDKIPSHLKSVQASDISTDHGLKEALMKIIRMGVNNNEDIRDQSIKRVGEKYKFKEYFKKYKEHANSTKNSSNPITSLIKILESVELNQTPACNTPTGAEAYTFYLERVIDRIKSWPARPLVVPSVEYAHYLVRLQEKLKITVSAVAIVDDVEKFWARRLGHQILNGSERGRTRRIFVFKDEQDLLDNEAFLRDHSKKYEVRLLSFQYLKAKYPDYARDFSILSTNDTDHVLARYVNDRQDTGIEFTTDGPEIQLHLNSFERIWKKAISIPDSKRIDSLAKEIFAPQRLEMSRYIKIKDYHLHEEKHAYFIEMMQRIITIAEQFRNSTFTKILEMGAGTGHLTKRISSAFADSAKIIAIEYDSECYTFLLQNKDIFSHQSNCEIINENSREYDPPGKFDIIVSSFADHHIIRSEAEADKYFEMVGKNLHSGASYIVGDEFLPEHDTTNPKSREAAIRSYHGHIIDVAKSMQEEASEADKIGYKILIELESKAMESGLNEEGDFKVSLSHYLQRLSRNGLRYDPPILIGPTDKQLHEKVGGIYVIRAYI